MMRVSKALGSLVATAAALVAITAATDARADAEFTATGGTGSVDVTPNTGAEWHVNLDGPWKVVGSDGKTMGKGKWTLTKDKATISGVPSGNASVSVYVCNGGQCVNRTVTVAVK